MSSQHLNWAFPCAVFRQVYFDLRICVRRVCVNLEHVGIEKNRVDVFVIIFRNGIVLVLVLRWLCPIAVFGVLLSILSNTSITDSLDVNYLILMKVRFHLFINLLQYRKLYIFDPLIKSKSKSEFKFSFWLKCQFLAITFVLLYFFYLKSSKLFILIINEWVD